MSKSTFTASDGLIGNQRRIAAEFIAQLRPHLERDRALPARIERLLKGDRRLGSRDRRLYRELIYTYLRFRPWLEESRAEGEAASRRFSSSPNCAQSPATSSHALAWLAADTPATHSYRSRVIAASPRQWPEMADSVSLKGSVIELAMGRALPSLLPEWAASECPVALEPAEYDVLHRRAPLWLRVKDAESVPAVAAELSRLGIAAKPSDRLPTALRLDPETDVTRTELFAQGQIEIQDLGSQLILATIAPVPGEMWLDACAGAGGKTLQLAGLLGPRSKVWVDDVRPDALAELEERSRRAGIANRIARLAGAKAAAPRLFDGVLIDAPCSGSGTWRRSPHLKWSTSPATFKEAAALQGALLSDCAGKVRPGGRLIYATCSLAHREDEDQIAAFLAEHPTYNVEQQRLFRPSEHDGDGFFVASLRRAQ